MITGAAVPTRDRQAIVLSFAVHLCAAIVLLSGLPALEPRDATAVEVVPQTEFITIVRGAPQPRPSAVFARHAHAAVVPARLVALGAKRYRKIATGENRAPAAHELHVERQHAPALAPLVAATDPGVPNAAATPVAAVNANAGTPVPAVSAAPAPVATPNRQLASMGAFGEEYTPSFDPPNLGAQIKGWFTSRFHVRVSVDENGHAIDLTWVIDVPDSALHERVAKTLMTAKYVPASCNGLPCAKTLDLQN